MNLAEKAYAVYKKASVKTFTQITTTELNVLYNILCRIRRDEAYRTELDAYKTPEGTGIGALIETYFNGYNARHGVRIEDTLTEFTDPDFAEGGYFILDTFRRAEDGTLAAHAPTEFAAGETAHVRATLYSTASREPIRVHTLEMISVSDDGVTETATAENTDSIDFTVTVSRPGSVKFKVTPKDEAGKSVLGMAVAYGGVLFSREQIRPTNEAPADFRAFWDEQVERMLRVDPTDETPAVYSGSVVSAYGAEKENFHKITPVDPAYLAMMRENGYALSPTLTDTHVIWYVHLKAPGPHPVTAFITVPKNAPAKSAPIRFIYDGYGVYSPVPSASSDSITVRCTHHGYPLGKPDMEYYVPLRLGNGICSSYGRGNGKVNAGYEDIRDCYMTYLLLRDLQVIRYCTDAALSGELAEMHEKWNGKIVVEGGSMGGYQTVCIGALTTVLREKVRVPLDVIRLSASIPAFCNLAGRLDRRVPTSLTSYEEGMEYYDPVHFAPMLDAPLTVPRAALGDETCPLFGIVAMFNSVPAGTPKEINFLQNSSHGYIPDADVQQWYRYKEE